MNYLFGTSTGIWAESSEKWDEIHPCWKIVGNNPTRIPYYKNECKSESKNDSKLLIDRLFDKIYYLVEFSSGRKLIGFSKMILENGLYVILEADRGEDCGKILRRVDFDGIEDIFNNNITGNEPFIPSNTNNNNAFKIIRLADKKDIQILEERKLQERKALEKCNSLIKEKGLSMEITGCEFQWDMKKITFYFKSEKRVDFRELVRELFKYFKIRIWMSMENRNKLI